MEYAILKKFQEVSDFVSQVSAIADKNREAFGFLSTSAYEQMASKGQLWVAVNKKRELKGYLMFGGTMPTLKIFQIYACKTVQGHGVGRRLIDALKEFAREHNYNSIAARVASDLPANRFWEKNGFSVYRQVKGGESTKRIINIRGYTLSDNDLFGNNCKEKTGVQPIGPVLDRPIYALDINLLLDIIKARPGYKKSVKIMQIGFQGGFSICITPEFKRELERQSANFPDDPVLRLAEAFPELNSDFDIAETAASLREIVFPSRSSIRKSAQNDESDLIHLAYCVAAGISGFITREKALLRACNDIKEKHNLAILSPDEIVLDDTDSPDTLTPLNTDFSFLISTMTDEIKSFLCDFKIPEHLINTLTHASPIKTTTFYEARLDNRLFGIYFFQKPTKATSSALAALYIDENCPQSIAAIDHFLEMALRHKSDFPYRLDLYIGKGQDVTEETLLKKGFLKFNDHFVKIVANHFITAKSWGDFSKNVKLFFGFSIPEKIPSKKELQNTGICLTDSRGKTQAFSCFDFETIIGPRFIVDPDRDCILVPIRENFANGLIGNTKKQLSLLSSPDKTLLLEKAYFRSPAKATLFKKGGIIAFYVSGSNSIQELIGFARVTYSDVVSVDEATIKLDRQGVLSHQELIKLSSKSSGKIHVFTFDNFIEFDRRISFSRAKELGLISNANLVAPEKIGVEQLKTLIRHAFK